MTSPFDSGVASGDPSADSIVLWTRVRTADDQVEVRWRIEPVGRSAGTESGEQSGIALARRDRDHTVHVDVDGLEPATTYVYQFRVDDDVIVGRTRTLPVTADRLRIAVACCARWGWPGFDEYEQIVAERPDVLLHLGDFIYEVGESPPSGPPTQPPWECHTLADYRQRHRQHRSNAALRELLAQVPMLVIWDDHEVADNAPDPDGHERRLAGQRAWAEWMPMRRTQHAEPLDRHLTVENLLDLCVVDTRFHGRAPTTTDGPGTSDDTPADLLSDEQWAALERAADRSSAPWFVVANQVQVGPMTLAARPAFGWPPWKRVVNPDQWDGYPAARERLYDIIGRASGRAVVLSGDLHSSWSRVLSGRDRSPVAHEFTCPSISGETYADAVRERLPIGAGWLGRWLRLLNPGVAHLDLARHGFLVCDITPDRFSTTFVMHDGDRHEISLSA